MPDFRKVNYVHLRYHLQSMDWEEIGLGRGQDQNNELEMHYNGIGRKILTMQEQYIPEED